MRPVTYRPPWRLQLSTVAVLAFATAAGAQQPVAPPGGPPLQVLGINSGPSGVEKNGVFTLSEERSIFSRSEDRQAIVVFQWAGAPGLHKLAALWRSPDGTQSAASTLDYMARESRFGAHWSLALPPSMALGTWSIEATVDGQPAGRYSFEVRDDKVVAAPVKRLLTNAELYERLNRVFVLLERSSTAGRPLDPAGGLLIGPGRIASAMFALDGADVVRAAVGTAAAEVVSSVVAYSRAQDWAILELRAGHAGALPLADPQTVSVGTKCFSMEGGPAGSRVLVEGQVTGAARVAGYSQPLVNFFNGTGTPGAPVITEFGELIGLVGGPGVTGATRIHELLRFRAELKGTLIVPIAAIRVPSVGVAQAIAQLRKDGQLVAPVVGDLHILSGGFARQFQERNRAQPSDQRHEFSAADKNFVAFVNWNPQERLRGMMFFRVYDKDNRLIDQSEPKKQDFRQERLIMTSWPLRVPPSPGRYRIDVLLDDRTMWRDFVTITP